LITGLLIIGSCGPQYPKEQSENSEKPYVKEDFKIETAINLESGINVYMLKHRRYHTRIVVAVNDSGGISLISFP